MYKHQVNIIKKVKQLVFYIKKQNLMSLQNTLYLIVPPLMIIGLLNYWILIEQKLYNDIVAKNYVRENLKNVEIFSVYEIKFVESLGVLVMALIGLKIKDIYVKFSSRSSSEQQQQKLRQLNPNSCRLKLTDCNKFFKKIFLWAQVILGSCWFLSTCSLSQVKLTHQTTIFTMFIQNLNLVPILILIKKIMKNTKPNDSQTQQKQINTKSNNLIDQQQIKSGLNLFIFVLILLLVALNLCIQDFLNLIFADINISLKDLIETVNNRWLILSMLANYGVFGVIYWLKLKYSHLSTLRLVVALTKFSSLFFGILCLQKGSLITVLNQLINQQGLIQMLAQFILLKFIIHSLICYSMINYSLLIFFAIYSTRRTFHHAKQFMIHNLQPKSVPFFICTFMLLFLIIRCIRTQCCLSVKKDKNKLEYQMMEQESINLLEIFEPIQKETKDLVQESKILQQQQTSQCIDASKPRSCQ